MNELTVLNEKLKHTVRSHSRIWLACEKCDISGLAYRKVLFRGSVPCDILFLGEGPGKTEDATGEPFVGRAGGLLDIWIEQALEEKPFIHCVSNLVACRPTDYLGGPNRAPSEAECHNCRPRVEELVQDIAKPFGIVLLGRCTTDNFSMAGKFKLCSLMHPSYVLRKGGENSVESESMVEQLKAFVRRVMEGRV